MHILFVRTRRGGPRPIRPIKASKLIVPRVCTGIQPLLVLVALQGCASAPPEPAGGAEQYVGAVRSGAPQAWADALQAYANSGAPLAGHVPALAGMLSADSADVRHRAALALGALGPLARPAVESLIVALSDPDPRVRAEVAFALHRTSEFSERVLEAIYNAWLLEKDGLVRSRIWPRGFGSIDAPHITVSESLDVRLRQQFETLEGWRRFWTLTIAAHTTAAWVTPAYVLVLNDPDPAVRSSAAWGLAAYAGEREEIRTAIAAQHQDTLQWVRENASQVLATFDAAPTPAMNCVHRTAGDQEPGAVLIESGAFALRDDRRGPYKHGTNNVRASHGTATNLLLSASGREGQPGIGVIPPAGPNPRMLEIDLSRPVAGSGARALGVVRDHAASFHTFYMWDAQRVIWNTRDIPVGSTVQSDRTEIAFQIRGVWHRLQMGPWAIGDCREPYAKGASIHGTGTTPVSIERISGSDFVVSAPTSSRGRLWRYSDPARPEDLGLYEFSFRMRILAPGPS